MKLYDYLSLMPEGKAHSSPGMADINSNKSAVKSI